MIKDLPPAQRREADRLAYVNYRRAAGHAAGFARQYEALAASIVPDRELVTFAEPLAAAIRRGYDQLAKDCWLASEQAQIVANSYRPMLDVEAAS